MQLGDRVAALLELDYFSRRRGLADQLDRAVVSISNNIAEGFERGTTDTLINYVYIAKGSTGETRSMLHGLAKRAAAAESPIRNSKSEIRELIKLSESVSRQLNGWANYVQNSALKGSRHVTNEVRERTVRTRSREAFLQELRRLTPQRGASVSP